MPFIDLKAQYRRIENEVKDRIHRILEHGRYIMGPEIDELEDALAKFVGVKHAISCSSGTDALIMPLLAYGVGPGDAVFTTPFTFVATAEVISLLGATPVFVDIDAKTFNLNPGALEEQVKRVKQEGKLRAKGIIPVDLFGLPADYDPIQKLADEEDLFVLEDTAQGLGGLYHGRVAGSFGHVAATSFFPAKPLGAYGDAGAVFTDDDGLADSMRSIRIHGQGENKYDNVRLGLNARMDSIQAAVMICKLAIFPEELDLRQKVAETYNRCLTSVETPYVPEGYRSSWAQYSVLADDRETCQKALQEKGIPTAIYYAIPLHLQKAYQYLGYRPGDMPVSETAAKRIFSLPMHPYLSEEQIQWVAESLNTR